MKANLARFTVAVSLLATMALTLGAGVKWVLTTGTTMVRGCHQAISPVHTTRPGPEAGHRWD